MPPPSPPLPPLPPLLAVVVIVAAAKVMVAMMVERAVSVVALAIRSAMMEAPRGTAKIAGAWLRRSP